MRITIKYEASWQNSFLDGSNNEPLPKGGRKFIGSMTTLSKKNEEGKYSNFKKREISHDTVMGILNRLIGEQRKLYQARQCQKYFFADIEPHITIPADKQLKTLSREMVYIRNMTGSTDQNSFTGMIKNDAPIFSSDYSNAFWGVLTLDFEELCQFVINSNFIVESKRRFDPLSTLEKLNQLNKLKPVEIVNYVQDVITSLQERFPDGNYKIIDGKIKPIEIYCSALYLQISRLSQFFDLSKALTKSGGINGISKRGVTPKDFMDCFTTGNKKPIWGNPYFLKERRKGEGEVISMLAKASGVLEINLDIPQEKARELQEMIEAAGVSSFYLGKKGLAYVDNIRI